VVFSIKFFGRALCFLLVVFFTQTVHAQSLHERSDQIHSSVESGNLNAALDGLKSLQTADASAFALNNYDYLLARLLERTGESLGLLFELSVCRGAALAAVTVCPLAPGADGTFDGRSRAGTRAAAAVDHYGADQFVAGCGDDKTRREFFGKHRLQRRPFDAAAADRVKDATMARRALTLSSEAYVRAGKPTEARDLFTKLATNMPDTSRPDDFALAAVSGLDALEKGEMAKAVSEADHLRRAGIYQFNRDFENARLHYLAVVEVYGQKCQCAGCALSARPRLLSAGQIR